MTAPNWRPSWTAFGCCDRADGDTRARARLGSSPTRAIVTRAVGGCSDGGRSHIPFPSAAIGGQAAPAGLVVPSPLTKRSITRRNVVERCINRLKQWRGLATRYEKHAVNYRAMVVLASLVLWLES